MSYIKSFILVLLIAGLTSCVGSSGAISTRLTLCCPGDYDNYRDYSLQTAEMPGFLSNYVVAEFDAALTEKGLIRNDGNARQVESGLNGSADLQITLRYNQVNLNTEQEEIDPFVTNESLLTELSYIAAIDIEMRETASGELVWAGSVSRLHSVVPGEYMHQDMARPAFRRAFRTVLNSYPAIAVD